MLHSMLNAFSLFALDYWINAGGPRSTRTSGSASNHKLLNRREGYIISVRARVALAYT